MGKNLNMNIGITGSTGVIGALLLRELSETNHSVSCFIGDIRNKSDVQEWVDGANFGLIFH